jgi:Tfp pilus assembly protein PilV
MKRSSSIRFRSKPCPRAGSILLEVSVSAFVLAIAVAGSSQYLTNALNSSEKTQRITRAALMCESRIAEALAEKTSAVTSEEGVFETDRDWRWKQVVESGPFSSVGRVTVLVFFETGKKPVCSLTRLFPIAREKSDSQAGNPR